MIHDGRDRGYAWVIVIGSFLNHVFQYGVVWTVGIFYVVFKEVFDNSSAYISLISSLNTAVYYMTGPVASLLTNKFGPRVVAMSGGLIGSLGLILSMFATSIYHLYVTFGFLTGFGFGIAYIPSISIVGMYFDKHRTIALGLAVSGCGIGTFIFPPMLRFFINSYGWRGALLLTGGVCLNMCVCGALMRPYTPPKDKNFKLVENDSTPKTLTKEEEAMLGSNTQEVEYKNGSIQLQKQEDYQKESSKKVSFKEHANLHVLKNKSYIMLCLNNFFFTFGLSIIYVHLSAYAASLGFSDDQGAMLFSALGIANFFGRILFGLIAHAPCISAISLYTIAFFMTGALTEICPIFITYISLMSYAILFGFLSASLGTLLPQVLIDILGVEMLTSGYGYVLIFEALGTLLGAPAAGWVYDSTQIYKSSLYLGGASIMFSSLLMTYPWFVEIRHKNKQKLLTMSKIVKDVDNEENV